MSRPHAIERLIGRTGTWGARSPGANGGSGGRDNDGSRAGSDSTSDVAVAAPVAQAPETPSALEGIPLDGLVITLLVAALIGATGGKIYVSLTDDD